MTASEFQSLETHSDATVCSGLYTKAWSTKSMHASKLLKGVLISRTLSNESQESASSANSTAGPPVRGKRAFSSSDSSSSNSNSSGAVTQKTATIKTTCLCAPTKHAGSFRCRLHRVAQKHWDGRSPSSASSSSSLPNSSAVNENAAAAAGGMVTPAWAPRTAARPSRLRMVVVAAQAAQADETDEADVGDPASPMLSESSVKYIKVATSTTIAQDVMVNETGASVSRKLHTSS